MAEVQDSFSVSGISCAACAVSIQSVLIHIDGVKKADVNVATHLLRIVYDDALTGVAAFELALQKIGYSLNQTDNEVDTIIQGPDLKLDTRLRRKMLQACVLSFPVFLTGMFFHHLTVLQYFSFALTLLVLVFPGRDFFIRSYKLVRHGMTNMDTLVALSTGISFLFSAFNLFFPKYLMQNGHGMGLYFESAAVVVAFVLLGKYLEEKAKYASTNALRSLMRMQPKTVWVVRNGQELELKSSEVQLHDRVLVKTGAIIPVDGVVIRGESFVDESSMTGEPMPVQRLKGDKVLAGTVVQNGVLTILAEKTGKETNLARIIRAVVEAQSAKAPIQKQVDKLAAWFVPMVIITSVLAFIGWIGFGGEHGIWIAITTSLTVLVIACPCALGLATPTALMAGLGQAALNGVLVRDPESLEQACKITTVIVDKTGTLTQGKPSVVDAFVMDGADLSVLYAICSGSEHPIAIATAMYLKTLGVSTLAELKTENLPGLGVLGQQLTDKYFFGSLQACSNMSIQFPTQLENIHKVWLEKGYSTSFFSKNSHVIAAIAVSDALKGTSQQSVAQLKKLGIEVFMATGDHEISAKKVAEAVGVERFFANLTPLQKVELIKDVKNKGERVAFIGDGINDAAALASADVSVAMGHGSDIAIGIAGLTLVHGDLGDFATAIGLSKKTVAVIKQNLFWAFMYNVLCIPIAAGVLFPSFGILLNPMIASAAMALSSITVVLNSLRLNYLNKIDGAR